MSRSRPPAAGQVRDYSERRVITVVPASVLVSLMAGRTPRSFRWSGGLINATFLVEESGGRLVVLQRLHPSSPPRSTSISARSPASWPAAAR